MVEGSNRYMIRKRKKYNEAIFDRRTFTKKVKLIASNEKKKATADAAERIQFGAETRIGTYLRGARLCSTHARRKTTYPSDMHLVYRLSRLKKPIYKTSYNDNRVYDLNKKRITSYGNWIRSKLSLNQIIKKRKIK